MPNQVPNVSVPAPVIQLNNKQFLVDGQYAPRTINIPCHSNAQVDDITYWMVPIKDSGIVSILEPVPAIGIYATSPPTPDSVRAIRVRDKYSPNYTWWVLTTLADYYAACGSCCGAAFVPIPTPLLPVIIPCQSVCEAVNAAGLYLSTFGVPADLGTYWAYGYFNGVVLPTRTAATLALLVTALNAAWSAVGSPARNFVWSTPAAGVLQAVGGLEGDSLCVQVFSIPASP
jgi:hypothetical protein